jgi:hypothetical protein
MMTPFDGMNVTQSLLDNFAAWSGLGNMVSVIKPAQLIGAQTADTNLFPPFPPTVHSVPVLPLEITCDTNGLFNADPPHAATLVPEGQAAVTQSPPDTDMSDTFQPGSG